MTEAANEVARTSLTPTPNLTALRTARVVRAITLFAVGLVIAFTATLHQNFDANRWMFAGAFTLLGLAMLLEYFVQRAEKASWPVAFRAALLFFAAIAALLVGDVLGLAIAVAVWAFANAVALYLPVIRIPSLRGQALPAAILSLALALAVMILRNDPVGVIGFFGVYALISGVFLGISAFDARAPQSDGTRRDGTQSNATQGNVTQSNATQSGATQTINSSSESTR